MDFTPFAGLERLLAGEPLDSRFLFANPTIIDTLLEVGAVTHRHDGHARLVDPVTAPTATPSNVGGAIPSDTSVYLGYTFIDADGGETLLSDTVQVSTAPGLPDPTAAPDAEVDYTAGTLLANTYYYAVTVIDGLGGETMIGPSMDATVDPGHAYAQITVSGLDTIMADVGGTGWRLWRAVGGGAWHMMVQGAGASVVDDGSFHGDCDVTPPTTPQTNQTNKLTVQVPGPAPDGAVSFNLYLSEDGSFADTALVANHLIADLGTDIILTDLTTVSGSPPPVSLTLPGASKIDPDTELVDWHWKRPVATVADLPALGNEAGDVRIVTADNGAHIWNDTDNAWHPFGGGGSTSVPIDEVGGSAANVPIWTKGGVPVLWLRGHESVTNETMMDEEFSEAAGVIADDYGSDGAGNGIPEASGNNTNAIHYPPKTPTWATLYDGYVERTFTITSANWTRIGVTLGTARTGLFAWITPAGNLEIATRVVDSNLEADFTVIATDALPAAPASGDTYNIQLERVGNHLHATVHQSKAVVAEVEIDIPAPLQATFGADIALEPGLSDRWSNPDAWTTDLVRAIYYHRLRQLYVEAIKDGGTTALGTVFDGVGDLYMNFGSQVSGAYSSADWADDATTPASYLRNSDHYTTLSGKAVKSTGVAPVSGDVILTLDPEATPVNGDILAAVATGDDDGVELGIVKIDTAGVVTWLAGRSTAPATKHPFVSFDGIGGYPVA